MSPFSKRVIAAVGLPTVLCLSLLARGAVADDDSAGLNIGLGKTYRWSAKPGYRHCTDPGDSRQLTDGEYVPGCDWTKKGTVGWSRVGRPLLLTIDLGKVQPIAGISYSTAAGSAGIHWPTAIMVLVSDDGEAFYNAGELTEFSALQAPIPASGAYRFRTDRLETHGRYVRLAVAAPSYMFCDEIEVYGGDAKLLARPHVGSPVADAEPLIAATATRRGVRRRLLHDIADMKDRVAGSLLPRSRKTEYQKALDESAALSGKDTLHAVVVGLLGRAELRFQRPGRRCRRHGDREHAEAFR